MGRRAIPKVDRKRQGTLRDDRHSDTPDAPPGEAVKPDWVKGDAARYWDHIAPHLDASGLLSVLDEEALGGMCFFLAEFVKSNQTLEKWEEAGGTPGMSVTPNGCLIQHPAVGLRNKAWEKFEKLAGKFGKTPSDRASIHMGGGGDDQSDPMAGLLGYRTSGNLN